MVRKLLVVRVWRMMMLKVLTATARVQAVLLRGRMGRPLVDAAVLLQVIATAESFGTNGAREWPQSGVDALVSSQLFVAGERLAARLFVAFEGSFTFFLFLTNQNKLKRLISIEMRWINQGQRLAVSGGGLTVNGVMNDTCVTANVSFELAVVAEGHLTVRASESLGSLLLARRVVMLVVSGGGRRHDTGAGSRRIMVLNQRLESGQLVELANFIGAHTQSGQTARMQSLGRGFQRGQESFHGRSSFRLQAVPKQMMMAAMLSVQLMERVGRNPPGKSRKERRRRQMVLAQ